MNDIFENHDEENLNENENIDKALVAFVARCMSGPYVYNRYND